MIAAWMVAATLFAALLGVAAMAAEGVARTLGREARGAWIAALTVAVGWPAAAPVFASAFARFTAGGAHAPSALAPTSFATVSAVMPSAPKAWIVYADVALVALWALTSTVLFIRLVWAMRILARLERTAERDVVDGVPVLVTPSLGPAVFGTRRMRVFVPRWLFELDAPLRSLVVKHEQEHCRARDPQLTLIVAVALALVPWNPAMWWIARRLRLAMELDCDARVVRDAGQAERYSKLLLFIAQRQSHVRLAPMLAEKNSHLSWRIAAMNSPRPERPRLRTICLVIVAAGSLAFSTRIASALTSTPLTSLGDLRHVARAVAPTVTKVESPPAAPTTALQPHAQEPRHPSSSARGSTDNPPAAVAIDHSVAASTVPPDSDRSVRAVPGSPAPRYPDILKTAGVEGGVLVSFVVDETGAVDAQSVRVLRSTHQLFAKAVTSVLPQMHFLPAILNNVPVRQVVRLPILFNIMDSPLSTTEGQRAALEKLMEGAPFDNFVTLSAIIITGVTQ
jgi:TonB family protein